MRSLWPGIAVLVLLSSVSNAQGSLTGYVRDNESLRALEGVELSVDGTGRKAHTNNEGKYNLRELPSGAVRLHVRLVGFAPIDTILTLEAASTTEHVFFLTKPVVALDTVRTRGRTPGGGFESFEIRRSKGFGRFMDSVYLQGHENSTFADLLRTLGSIEIATPGTCTSERHLWCSRRVAVKAYRGGGTRCLTQVVLDGAIVSKGAIIDDRDPPPGASKAVRDQFAALKEAGWSGAFDLNIIGVTTLRGVELYRNAADAQDVYGGDDAGCGVLVLWTRRG